MKLLRNKEVFFTALAALILGVLGTVAAWIRDPVCGIVTAAVCAGFCAVGYWNLRCRYRKIGQLAAEIDRILHGDEAITLDGFSEGELSILQSEISKMTVRLREQQQRLQEDKIYLADSIADISHQIRTPLTTINLLVEFLSQPDLEEERRPQLTRELFELLGRIDWLITTLLKISKLNAGTVQFKDETVPLREMIDRAASPLLVPMELRGQTLISEGEGTFRGDLGWTCEALGNIIKNCMEHTPDGGTVSVTGRETGIYAEIVVTDTGAGIAKEDLPHIFERFYKGKNSDEKSFGIGLALARMIVTRQNGTVKAENLPGGGAKFLLKFYKGTL